MISFSRGALAVIAVTVVLLALATWAVYYVYLSPTGLKARETSPLGQSMKSEEALYISLDGTPLDMRSFEGTLLIVNMWASWSPFTKEDHVVLHKLKQEFGESITIRAVNRKEDVKTALVYLETIGREEGLEYIVDTTDFLYSQNGGYAMPETMIFDEVGNEVAHYRGTLTFDDIRSKIDGFLKKSE